MFERLTKLYGDEVTALLTVQYRMNESIMRWSSEELYDGKVRNTGICRLKTQTG
jgi:superfamily I DNA and/or RNA helicase